MTGPAAPTPSALATLRPLPLSAVRFTDGLLGGWQERNATATLPHCIDQLGTQGNLTNLRRVTGDTDAEFANMWFADTDVYKTLEAVAGLEYNGGCWVLRVVAHRGWPRDVEPIHRRATAPVEKIETVAGRMDPEIAGELELPRSHRAAAERERPDRVGVERQAVHEMHAVIGRERQPEHLDRHWIRSLHNPGLHVDDRHQLVVPDRSAPPARFDSYVLVVEINPLARETNTDNNRRVLNIEVRGTH
jgi:hypothetical protein